ncbi:MULTISPECIES: substrate-binding periplasmic protein [Halomonadaceae]|uniref:Transporter substrate-binding domain-containing protein n=1 Tax=Vreelandella halophila TaxID=86177 RepID=A0A9X4Y9V8_9GAMM|nr:MULTISPECIES: transporter substrate-binding domain-containing protein [Halomonas]MYL25193.1 transporter substrate-binding domain-containing protein [Halomonas utahensis]MYL75255.1 transporter substrate-binding domain-containing protein [Halomonas sp. 22501_18_FS]
MIHGLTHRAIVVWLLAALATSVTAKAAPAASGPLRLVTGPHYAPYAADYLPHNGLGPFLVTRILEDSNRTVTVDMRPWRRAYRETLKGRYDAALPYIETPSRQQDYLFSVPIFRTDTFAYVRADSELDARSLEGLKGLTYCNPVGFTDEDALKTMREKGQITRVKPANLRSCFRMLTAGRVDFVKINHHVAEHIVSESELSAEAVRPLPFVVEEVSLHFMVPKTRPGAAELIDEFNRRFRAMKQEGRIEALKRAYMEALRAGGDTPGDGPHRIGPSAAEAIGR